MAAAATGGCAAEPPPLHGGASVAGPHTRVVEALVPRGPGGRRISGRMLARARDLLEHPAAGRRFLGARRIRVVDSLSAQGSAASRADTNSAAMYAETATGTTRSITGRGSLLAAAGLPAPREAALLGGAAAAAVGCSIWSSGAAAGVAGGWR